MQPLGGGADWLEWQAALSAGVVEATQVFYEDRAELLRADWITTPKREYQIVPPVDGAAEGVVANVEGVRHGDVNDALQATSFAELLAVSPVRTSAAVIGERRYVVLQYERPPAAVLRWLARGENRTTGLVSTRLWLDAETAELVRAETELPVEALSTSAELFQFRAVEFEEHRRNVEIVLYRTDRGLPAREGSVELTQVFGSYGDEIVIDEPHSEGVFELHETP
jgi:hypothetical protein